MFCCAGVIRGLETAVHSWQGAVSYYALPQPYHSSAGAY